MDEYSQRAIKFLLENDRTYLQELLQDVDVKLNQISDSKIIGQLLENQKVLSTDLHKSSIYVCKCGSNHVISREIQKRSSDEGSTIIHICLDCKNHW